MTAVALPLASSALGSTAGASGLGSFLSKLGGGGMGGFFSGFGNSITGLPVMQAFGQDPSPMGSFGQLLGGGLLGGDFSNAGQAYMLGGGMGGSPMMGQQVIGQGGGQYQPTPGMNMGGQISNAEAQRMMAEMMQQQMPYQNMMMPLDTMTDPRMLMGGLLGNLSPSMRNRQIGMA
jgi:hypothetical protein